MAGEVDRKRKRVDLSSHVDDPLALSLSFPVYESRTTSSIAPPTSTQDVSNPIISAAVQHDQQQQQQQQPPLASDFRVPMSAMAGPSTSHDEHIEQQQQQQQSRHIRIPMFAMADPPASHVEHIAQQQQLPLPQPPHRRVRRNHSGERIEIEPPFPWATNRRAEVYSIKDLLTRGIDKIRGEARCRHCDGREEIVYDLCEKFAEVASFIAARQHAMHDRAPLEWMNPRFPPCQSCTQTNCMKPVIAPTKSNINWLFLLLGQTLGCCTLEQLKYFCKHAGYHRTGAKDRVLYLTYFVLCNQLDPEGPFKISTMRGRSDAEERAAASS